MKRVSSFKYLTWTIHIQTQVKKARQRLYHLRQLRKFGVSPAILKNFYSGAIESILSQCGMVTLQIRTAKLCRELCAQLSTSQGLLSPLYRKIRAAKIIKDSNHPGNSLFILLPSGRRFRSMMANTERLKRSFFPQAIRLLNTNS